MSSVFSLPEGHLFAGLAPPYGGRCAAPRWTWWLFMAGWGVLGSPPRVFGSPPSRCGCVKLSMREFAMHQGPHMMRKMEGLPDYNESATTRRLWGS